MKDNELVDPIQYTHKIEILGYLSIDISDIFRGSDHNRILLKSILRNDDFGDYLEFYLDFVIKI